jgi:hypothetical protein
MACSKCVDLTRQLGDRTKQLEARTKELEDSNQELDARTKELEGSKRWNPFKKSTRPAASAAPTGGNLYEDELPANVGLGRT